MNSRSRSSARCANSASAVPSPSSRSRMSGLERRQDREPETSLHACRIRVDGMVDAGRQPAELGHVVDPPPHGCGCLAELHAEAHDVVATRRLLIEALRRAAEQREHATVHLDAAARRRQHAGHDREQRRLAGTVGAHEPEPRAVRYFEVDPARARRSSRGPRPSDGASRPPDASGCSRARRAARTGRKPCRD